MAQMYLIFFLVFFFFVIFHVAVELSVLCIR